MMGDETRKLEMNAALWAIDKVLSNLTELRAKVRRNAEGYAQANDDAKVAECNAQADALTAVEHLAAEIRRVDGAHTLGAGALAEALWPFIAALTPNDTAERYRDACDAIDAAHELSGTLAERISTLIEQRDAALSAAPAESEYLSGYDAGWHAALSAAPAARYGWVQVPFQMTGEMARAMVERLGQPDSSPQDTWTAVLGAAPYVHGYEDGSSHGRTGSAAPAGECYEAKFATPERLAKPAATVKCDFCGVRPGELHAFDCTALDAAAPTPERGEWPARFFAAGPQGSFFTDSHPFAEQLISRFERDDWTITDLENPGGV